MKIFPACHIIENKGKLGIDVASRYGQEFQEDLKTFKGHYVQVILKKPDKPATEAQNNVFHALLGLYFKSGLHSASGYDDLRATIKIRYGWVFDYDIEGEKYKVVVSWAKYTREWRIRAIDGLISEMEQSGILGSTYHDEYQEIRQGMQNENKGNKFF